jgi:hypothetical protein
LAVAAGGGAGRFSQPLPASSPNVMSAAASGATAYFEIRGVKNMDFISTLSNAIVL